MVRLNHANHKGKSGQVKPCNRTCGDGPALWYFSWNSSINGNKGQKNAAALNEAINVEIFACMRTSMIRVLHARIRDSYNLNN